MLSSTVDTAVGTNLGYLRCSLLAGAAFNDVRGYVGIVVGIAVALGSIPRDCKFADATMNYVCQALSQIQRCWDSCCWDGTAVALCQSLPETSSNQQLA